MRKIYGAPTARTNYCIWVMEELGLTYENIPVNPFSGETKTAEYKALNPNGLIPTLEEDGQILWESMAVNFYLAKTYGRGKLMPDDPWEEALVLQWSLFGIQNLDKLAVNCILHKIALPEEHRDEGILKSAEEGLVPHLQILNTHLSGRQYLVGEAFSLADLNLAAMLDYARKARVDFSPYPDLETWLGRCLDRPVRRAMGGRKTH